MKHVFPMREGGLVSFAEDEIRSVESDEYFEDADSDEAGEDICLVTLIDGSTFYLPPIYQPKVEAMLHKAAESDRVLTQAYIDKTLAEARRLYAPHDPMAAVGFLETVLGTPRELTQTEKDHALTLAKPGGK